MKTWDVIIVGGGIIGLSLAIELRKQNAQVLVIDRGELGREASHAAAGMLADSEFDYASPLKSLASASARMYPEFVHELQDESGINCDLRNQGTLQFCSPPDDSLTNIGSPRFLWNAIADPEPALARSRMAIKYLKERSVDPRALTTAALKAAKHRSGDIVSGSEVLEVLQSDRKITGVRTDKSPYNAPVVVNCAGAWAGRFGPEPFPTRPVKGHMLCVVGGPMLGHVIRSRDVYIVPRSDGRILIGSTIEEAGFDKRVEPQTIKRLRQAAINLIPAIGQSRISESWAGLRPGTPDNLPILGAAPIPGYFVAAGHFRDGILLAPITARVIADLIMAKKPDYDLSAFSPGRFLN